MKRCINFVNRLEFLCCLLQMLSYACRKAKPRSKHHSIISEAFRKTFERVHHSYGFFNRLELYGTEEEMLSDFIIQILHRELVEDTINRVKPGPKKMDTIKRIKQSATRTAYQSSSMIWKKSLIFAKPLLQQLISNPTQQICFDDEISQKFTALMLLENSVRVELTGAVSKIVDPVLIDVATTFCAPLLANIAVPITQAFEESITGFKFDIHHYIVEHTDNLDVKEKILRDLDDVHRRVSNLSGSFLACRDILWDMYTSNCSNLLPSSHQNGLDAYDLYCEICDSIRMLVHNAIHHFGVTLCRQERGKEPDDILADVITMMREGNTVACADVELECAHFIF